MRQTVENPSYRIGIDLGTTNCAMAAISAHGEELPATFVVPIPQQETAHSETSTETLPSFLFLAQSGDAPEHDWIAGRFARSRMAVSPERVVHSAKSWMVHHAVDRSANILPFGSGEIADGQKISPVAAQSLLLKKLARAWDSAMPGAPFASQEITITVPASFDPAAQQLTLDAAAASGFPSSTMLLEEPQAAFYAWLEKAGDELDRLLEKKNPAHVLVIDLGGGTTDFSLFEVAANSGGAPRLRRVAVSDHILLGGDNLDLALAHHAEKSFGDVTLPPSSFSRLVAACREIKEEALGESEGMEEKVWPLAVALPGRSLIAGTVRGELRGAEARPLLLDGFFPEVRAAERPLRSAGGVREMGLPYAKDPAVTRHLADFLRDRPHPDAVLFNGGLTKSPAVRERILDLLARWKSGERPEVMANTDPDLAVAHGAAWFRHLLAVGGAGRIGAGASHSYYIEAGKGRGVCVLPKGAHAEKTHRAAPKNLRVILGRAASFSLFRNGRRDGDKAGNLVDLNGQDFFPLPPVTAVVDPPRGGRRAGKNEARVEILATLRPTGLLRLELECAEPGMKWEHPFPLDFSLRGSRPTGAPESPAPGPSSSVGGIEKAAGALREMLLTPASRQRDRLTGNAVFSRIEQLLGMPRKDWSGSVVRGLFDALPRAEEAAALSAANEESWWQLAGFLLRPGYGMPEDATRLPRLVIPLSDLSSRTGAAVRLQRWIAARRIAAGLPESAASGVWDAASIYWPQPPGDPPAELVLLAGALESLPVQTRSECADKVAASIARAPGVAASWKALGGLLSRVPTHAGAEKIVPPSVVEKLWRNLSLNPGMHSIPENARADAAACWLRAARMTNLRAVDVPGGVVSEIDKALGGWGIPESRRAVLHEAAPVAVSDRASFLGEAPPSGLSL